MTFLSDSDKQTLQISRIEPLFLEMKSAIPFAATANELDEK
jgi:hypothetical protein